MLELGGYLPCTSGSKNKGKLCQASATPVAAMSASASLAGHTAALCSAIPTEASGFAALRAAQAATWDRSWLWTAWPAA